MLSPHQWKAQEVKLIQVCKTIISEKTVKITFTQADVDLAKEKYPQIEAFSPTREKLY